MSQDRFTIRWDASMGCYRVSVPNLSSDGESVEVVHAGAYDRLREAAAVMATTMRDVLTIVEADPNYPWQGGALKQQMREDITAYELLGLDVEEAADAR